MDINYKKYKKIFEKNKRILENFSFLTLLQVVTMLVPVVTYPYLIRILGSDLYGRVIYAQVFISYFSIIISLGFKSTAAKDISIYRNDKSKISEIISSIYTIRIFVWFFCFLLLILLIYLIPELWNYKWLYFFSFGYTLNELLFPQYYFIGIEKMKFVSLINIFIKLLFFLLIFIFIKMPSDYLFVPLLNSFGFLIGGIISVFIIFKKHEIEFKQVPLRVMYNYTREAFPLFASGIVTSIKDKFAVLLLGGVMGMQDVAVYDLGMRLIALFNKPIDIINTVIFPKIAKEKNITTLIKVTKLSFIFIGVMVLFLQFFLKYVLFFLTNDNCFNNIFEIRLMLIVPLITCLSLPLARNLFIAFGYYKLLFKSMIVTTIFYLLLVFVSYIFDMLDSLFIFVMISLLVYLFELVYRLILTNNNKNEFFG